MIQNTKTVIYMEKLRWYTIFEQVNLGFEEDGDRNV